MRYLQKHKLLNTGAGFIILLMGSLTAVAPTVSADIACSPNLQTATGYQQCVKAAPTGSTIICSDGSSVVVPATCPTTKTPAAAATCSDGTAAPGGDVNQCETGGPHCGRGANAVKTSISIGCKGEGNPILDMLFAFIRFLSDGVGLVLVASLVWAGIQYTSSRGDPNASAEAMKRIQSVVIALLIFIFAYAILNYVVPGTFLTPSAS